MRIQRNAIFLLMVCTAAAVLTGFAWLGTMGDPARNDAVVPGTLTVTPPALLQQSAVGHDLKAGMELMVDTGTETGAMVLLADREGLQASGMDHAPLWYTELPGIEMLVGGIHATEITPGLIVVLLSDPDYHLLLLDARDGHILWTSDELATPDENLSRSWFVFADLDSGTIDNGYGVSDIVFRWHTGPRDYIYGITIGQDISRGQTPGVWVAGYTSGRVQNIPLLIANTDNDEEQEVLAFLGDGRVSVLSGVTGEEDRRWNANEMFAADGGTMNRHIFQQPEELPHMAVVRDTWMGAFNLVDGSPLWFLDFQSSGDAPVLARGPHIVDLDGDGSIELIVTVYNDTDGETDADGVTEDHDGVNAPQRWATLVFDASTGAVKASLLDFAVVDIVSDESGSFVLVTDGPATEDTLPDYYTIKPLSWNGSTWQSGTALDTALEIVYFEPQPGAVSQYDGAFIWWSDGDFARHRLAVLEPQDNAPVGARWAAIEAGADGVSLLWEHTAPGGLFIPLNLYQAGDYLGLSLFQSDGASGVLNVVDDTMLTTWRLEGTESLTLLGALETSCAAGGPALLLSDGVNYIHEMDDTNLQTMQSTSTWGMYRILHDNDCALVASLSPGGVDVPFSGVTMQFEDILILDAITLDTTTGVQGLVLSSDTGELLAGGYTLEDQQQQFLSGVLEIGGYNGWLLTSDLNGDSVKDMVIAGAEGVAAVSGSDGTVIFSVVHGITEDIYQMMLADVSADTLDDIVFLSETQNGQNGILKVLSGTDGAVLLDLLLAPGADTLAAADLNQDDARDIIAGYTGTGAVVAYNGQTGEILWTRSVGEGEMFEDATSGIPLMQVMTAMVDDSGVPRVLVVDLAGYVYTINAVGELGDVFQVEGPVEEMVPLVTDSGTQLLFHSHLWGTLQYIGTGQWDVPQNVREVAIDESDNQQDIDQQENSDVVLCACDYLADVSDYTIELHSAAGVVLASQSVTVPGEEPAAVVGPVRFDGLNLSMGQQYFCAARSGSAPALEAYIGFGDGLSIIDRTGPSIEIFAALTPVTTGAAAVPVELKVVDRTALDLVRYYGPGAFDGYMLAESAVLEETLSWMPVTPGGDTLPDGSYRLWVEAVDRVGNYSEAFTDVILDSVAPEAPAIEAPEENAVVTTDRPVISGSVGDDAVLVTVSAGDVELCTAIPENQAWECVSVALEDDSYTISATARDIAGNQSDASAELSFLVRTEGIVSPTIQYPVDGSTTTDTTPEIGGRGEIDAALEVLVDGVVACSVTVDSNGAWFCTSEQELEGGMHAAQARQLHPYTSQLMYSQAVSFAVDVPVDGDQDEEEADIVEEEEPEEEQEATETICEQPDCPECKDEGGCSGNAHHGWATALILLMGCMVMIRRRRGQSSI